MNTRTVPVDLIEKAKRDKLYDLLRRASANGKCQEVADAISIDWNPVIYVNENGKIKIVLAAAPPRSEPDELCCTKYATCTKPCTPRGRWLERQTNAAPERIEGMQEQTHERSFPLAQAEPSSDRPATPTAAPHEHYDGQNECTICDRAASEQILAARERQARGEGLPGDTITAHYDENAAATQVAPKGDSPAQEPREKDRKCSGPASAAAPITSRTTVSACSRCGKIGVAVDDGHGCFTVGTITDAHSISTEETAHGIDLQGNRRFREQVADAKARQADGEGVPGDAELAHYKGWVAEQREHILNAATAIEKLSQQVAEKDREIAKLQSEVASWLEREPNSALRLMREAKEKAEAELAELRRMKS